MSALEDKAAHRIVAELLAALEYLDEYFDVIDPDDLAQLAGSFQRFADLCAQRRATLRNPSRDGLQ